MKILWVAGLAAGLAAGSTLLAQQASVPAFGTSPAEQAIVAHDPPFVAPRLRLTDLPRRIGRPVHLFNGRDLAGWDSWLGLNDPKDTYAPNAGRPIGLNRDRARVFSVVSQDGAPAIRVSGRPFGALLTKRAYANYHLRLQYKWGEWVMPESRRNSGLLYHSHGPYGAFFGTYMGSVEFQIVPGSIGMLLPVGTSRPGRSIDGIDWRVGAKVRVGQDRSLYYPWRRYMPGGVFAPVKFPAYGVEPASDAEKPAGEWNTLDLYVLGDRAIHVVNGVPVLAAQDLTTTDSRERRVPLTKGRIQLESEGAEIFFRDLTIVPITRLPTISSLAPR